MSAHTGLGGRFTLTLCLSSVRTKDGQPFVVSEQADDSESVNREVSVSIGKETVMVDQVVPRALPSRVAAAVVSAIEAAPPHTHSAHVLVGAPLFAGDATTTMAAAVVENMIHAQHVESRGSARLFFDECLVFGYETVRGRVRAGTTATEEVMCCHSVRATDAWTVIQQEVLSNLRHVSLVMFQYSHNRTATILLGAELTTAHVAALTLAARRGVYLCVDALGTAQEIATCVQETRGIRESLGAFSTAAAETRTSRAVPGGALLRHKAAPGTPGASETSVGRMLDALARSDEEYAALNTAVEEDLKQRLAQAQSERDRLEAQLREERAAHRLALEQLQASHTQRGESASRVGLVTTPRSGPSVAATSGNGPSLVGYRVDQDDSAAAVVVQELREALKQAQRGRQFAEEKLRLLEFKHGLEDDLSQSRSGRSVSVTRAAPSSQPDPTTTSAAVLHNENLALAQEFQRREQELQLQLREMTAELTMAQAARREMENTLLLQSRTIAEAKRALAVARGQSVQATLTTPPRTPPLQSGGMISPTRGPAESTTASAL